MPTRKIEIRNGTRQPQALNASRRHRVLNDEDDGQRKEQSERRRDLNEAGVEAAPSVRHVLGDIDGGAAVFAAERQSLQHADHEQGDRRGNADGGVRRQEADERRRAAHDQQRDRKRIFAPDEIADAPEEQRAERPDDETRRQMWTDRR